MKILFDFFPIILFFLVYKFQGIYAATAVAIVASVLQIVWLALRKRKIEPMQWVSLVIIVVFGGATLLLQDATFIKWKPTVLYWLFAVGLVVAQWGFQKNLIRSMMGQQITLPDTVWMRLNLSWIVFFTLMGVLNLYVAYSFSENAWVNFKLFGGMGLMLVFVIGQGLALSKYVEEEPASESQSGDKS